MIFGKISKNMMVKVKAWEPTSLLVNWETPQLCWGTNSKTKPAISASDKSYHPRMGIRLKITT